MVKDYRNTNYCLEIDDVIAKKNELEKVIGIESNKKNFYTAVRDTKEYKNLFVDIYNKKCSYCGNSIYNITAKLMELDHFLCNSIYGLEPCVNKPENIVLSCFDCNRSKGSFNIEGEYRELLNPDLEKIKSVFKRGDDYRIIISDEYEDDEVIKNFYIKLKLGYDLRRLDYLIMVVRGMRDKAEDGNIKTYITTIYEKLRDKRLAY